ncbi:MAG: hypothetical protein LBK99_27480 [Opitutaceae bacterium]|jgi:hypothetical protein|nr:hypothetical protein [Opitutaceae bacterium]
MSRLHIIIGYADPRPASAPKLVYLGRDGAAALKAREASPYPVNDHIANPSKIRRNLPPAKARANHEAHTAARARSEAAALAAHNRQLDLAREQGASAEREKHTIELGEHNRQLAELRERLAAKDAVSPAPESTEAEAPAKAAKKK